MATTPASWWSKDTVAVVTGGNKGIGYELVRMLAEHGLKVVLTARDAAKGQAAIDALKAQGLQSVVYHPLEVTRPESIRAFATWLEREFGGIDILINNAAILGSKLSYEEAEVHVETNYIGVKNVTEALLPLLRASPAGARIVNVSARLGLYERFDGESLKQKFRDEGNYSIEWIDSLAAQYLKDMKAGRVGDKDWQWIAPDKVPMYSETKIFMGAYSIVMAKSLAKSQPEDHKILLASFCPGATQTGMLTSAVDSGFIAHRGNVAKSVEDGAENGVWLALMPKEELVEKNGKFFGERKEYSFGMTVDF